MNLEPYVWLPRKQDFDNWGKEEEVAENQKRRQSEKWRFYRHAFDYLKDNRVAGNYLEFGCHRVRTFRMALSAARMENMDAMRFFAFDSFSGLPPNADGGAREDWIPGALKTSAEEFMVQVSDHAVYLDKIEPIPGFYKDSLTADLAKRVHEAGGAAFVTIDCDLRESAECVLDFLARGLINPGAVIYLDDWFAGFRGHPDKGVQGAWRSWEPSRNFQRFMDVGWWGRSFVKC